MQLCECLNSSLSISILPPPPPRVTVMPLYLLTRVAHLRSQMHKIGSSALGEVYLGVNLDSREKLIVKDVTLTAARAEEQVPHHLSLSLYNFFFFEVDLLFVSVFRTDVPCRSG